MEFNSFVRILDGLPFVRRIRCEALGVVPERTILGVFVRSMRAYDEWALALPNSISLLSTLLFLIAVIGLVSFSFNIFWDPCIHCRQCFKAYLQLVLSKCHFSDTVPALLIIVAQEHSQYF